MAFDRAIFLLATIAIVIDLSFVLEMKREYRILTTKVSVFKFVKPQYLVRTCSFSPKLKETYLYYLK